MSKIVNPSNPYFTIITVVYNGASTIEETIKSILSQTFTNFQFIVIDGGSKDGTLEILDRYKEGIDVLVTEKDNGIYDAMNKGIALATGMYTNFMNSGDRFYNEQTLEIVSNFSRGLSSEADIIYGKAVKFSTDNSGFLYEIGKPITASSFFLSIPICHQAMFTRTSLFTSVGKYEMEYKVAADYAWQAKYYYTVKTLNGIQFVPERIAYYLDGGQSFQMKSTCHRERLRISQRFFSKSYNVLNQVLYYFEMSKAAVLPIMVKIGILDTYRKIKYTMAGQSVSN